MSVPQAFRLSARPAARMVRAALVSRSSTRPHAAHSNVRIDNGAASVTAPHVEQVLLVGTHRSMSTSSRPQRWHFSASHPHSAVSFASVTSRCCSTNDDGNVSPTALDCRDDVSTPYAPPLTWTSATRSCATCAPTSVLSWPSPTARPTTRTYWCTSTDSDAVHPGKQPEKRLVSTATQRVRGPSGRPLAGCVAPVQLVLRRSMGGTQTPARPPHRHRPGVSEQGNVEATRPAVRWDETFRDRNRTGSGRYSTVPEQETHPHVIRHRLVLLTPLGGSTSRLGLSSRPCRSSFPTPRTVRCVPGWPIAAHSSARWRPAG